MFSKKAYCNFSHSLKNATFVTRLFYSLAVTIFTIAALYLIFGFRYEVNDDAAMANIAAGAFSGDSTHLVFINFIIGYLVRVFYIILPQYNHLYILFFCLSILCYALAGVYFIQKFDYIIGTFAQIILVLFAGLDLFTRWHFSKFAALFIITCICLVLLNFGSRTYVTFIGIALCVFGSMVRFELLAAIGALSAPLIIWKFCSLDKKEKLTGVITMSLMLLLCGLFFVADAEYYRYDEGWAKFTSYNKVRAEISDYRFQFADYGALKAAGMSENDIYIMKNWRYYDSDVFSLQRLQQLKNLMPPIGSKRAAVKNTFFAILGSGYGHPQKLFFAAVLLIYLFYATKKSKIYIAATVKIYAAILLYLMLRGRYIERIDFSFLLAMSVFISFGIKLPKLLSKRNVMLFFCLLLLVSAPLFRGIYQQKQLYNLNNLPLSSEFDSYFADKTHLYIVDVDYFDAAMGYDVWLPRAKDSFSSIVFNESWTMYSPYQEKALNDYGLQNLYKDSIDNKNVFWVSLQDVEMQRIYFKEHYGDEVEMVQANTQHSLFAYQIEHRGTVLLCS